MSEQRPPRVADLPHIAREHLATLPQRWRDWRAACREDPAALWRNPVVRLVGLCGLVILLVLGLNALVSALTPRGAGDAGFVEATPLATLHVACTNPDCRAAYTVKLPMDHATWPLKCEKCGQSTVYRATRCRACRRWFATAPGAATECPFCRPADAPTPPVAPTGRSGTDDDEDPW